MTAPTDEALNLAMCEEMGWKWHPGNDYHNSGWLLNDVWREVLPNYIVGLEALNNMHEAEKGLTEDEWMEYGGQIAEITGQKHYYKHYCSGYAMAKFAHLTAKQRALAYLRVKRPGMFL